MQKKYYLITFNNIYEVIKSEKILKNKGAKINIIPIPNEINISCGKCIKIEDSIENIEKYIFHIKYNEIYLFKKNFLFKNFKKINI